jgi:hypothetical protein
MAGELANDTKEGGSSPRPMIQIGSPTLGAMGRKFMVQARSKPRYGQKQKLQQEWNTLIADTESESECYQTETSLRSRIFRASGQIEAMTKECAKAQERGTG